MEGVYNRLPIPYFYNWPCEALLTGAFCDYSQQTLATSLVYFTDCGLAKSTAIERKKSPQCIVSDQ